MARRHRGRGRPFTWERVARYAAKIDPETTARLIERQKDTMVRLETEYQAIHNFLVEQARMLVNEYGREAFRLQAYVWYAQEVWYCVTHYTGEARNKCVVEKFVSYKCRGLEEEILRRLAAKLGASIPAWDEILTKYLKVTISFGRGVTVWGYPVVALGTKLPVYIHAESEGLQIRLRVTRPDGSTYEILMDDIGDGNYRAFVTFDQKGVWLLEAIFPDGHRMKKMVVVQ